MKATRNVHARQFQCGAGAALAVAMLTLGGCQTAPRAGEDRQLSVAMFSAVMSPGGRVCEPVAPVAATGTASTTIEFVPMFAAASTHAFSPVRIDLDTDGLAASGAADTEEAEALPRFLPIFAAINSPARWSARLVLDESAIVNDAKSREGARR